MIGTNIIYQTIDMKEEKPPSRGAYIVITETAIPKKINTFGAFYNGNTFEVEKQTVKYWLKPLSAKKTFGRYFYEGKTEGYKLGFKTCKKNSLVIGAFVLTVILIGLIFIL